MNAKTNTAKPEEKEPQAQLEKKKICFVIMPIADMAGYDTGHFTRVYEHLIKPACESAGFKPIRSDEVSSSHMIVVDILQKIVESDIAICDLSGKNPNVLYELGLRQAFNKKTVLIKDNKTDNIFDVQGFRYFQYDHVLRIDNVNNEVLKISTSLKETIEATNDINSIVQLLQIEPAKVGEKTKLSAEETILLNAINNISKKLESLPEKEKSYSEVIAKSAIDKMTLGELFSLDEGMKIAVGRYFETKDGTDVGFFKKMYFKGNKFVYQFETLEKEIIEINNSDRQYDIHSFVQGPIF